MKKSPESGKSCYRNLEKVVGIWEKLSESGKGSRNLGKTGRNLGKTGRILMDIGRVRFHGWGGLGGGRFIWTALTSAICKKVYKIVCGINIFP